MSMLDALGSSLTGLNAGLSLLNTSARALAGPSAFAPVPAPGFVPPAAPPAPSVTTPNSGDGETGPGNGSGAGARPVSTGGTSTGSGAPASAASLNPTDATDFMSAMIDLLLAKDTVAINARVFSTQNRMLGSLINLGA